MADIIHSLIMEICDIVVDKSKNSISVGVHGSDLKVIAHAVKESKS